MNEPMSWETYLGNTWTPSMANWVKPSGSLITTQPAQQQQQAPAVDPELMKRLQAQYGRLTGQASNALYGGILGYNPQPMTANGGQQFNAPEGNLQSPFANMQGLLGRPQFQSQGGMGQMMMPKFNMGG